MTISPVPSEPRSMISGARNRPTVLLAILAAATLASTAQAQKPAPPLLLAGARPVSDGIIFRETFDGMVSGVYSSISGKWNTSSNPNGSVVIADAKPVGPGFGKYMRPRLVRNNPISARAEYSALAPPSRMKMTVSGDDSYSTTDHWYGYVLCIDRFDQPDDGTNMSAHFNQWHEWGNGQWNPLISLMGNANGLRVYMERNEEGGKDGMPGPSVTSPVLYDPALGECFNVIWQFRADSRVSSKGSNGLLRIWIGDDPKPKWEWVNKATTHKLSHGGEDVLPYNKIGGYLSGWAYTGDAGDTYEARYDNYTVMDSRGSWAAMTAALADPD